MKIKKVTIKNFRLFKKLISIKFEGNFTSLVGKNGSGKTSILEAINLATSFYFIENKIKEDDFNDSNKDIEITVEFDDFFFINIPTGWQIRKLPSKTIKFVAKHREKATPGKAFSGPFVCEHRVIPYEFDDRNKLSIENKNNIPKSVTKEEDQFKFKQEDNKEVEISERLLAVNRNLEGFPNVFYFSKNRDKDLKKGFSTTFRKITDELNWRFLKKYKEQIKSAAEKKADKNSNKNAVPDYVLKWEKIYKYIISQVEDPKQKKIIGPLREEIKSILGSKFNKFEISLFNLKQPFDQSFFSLRDGDKIIGLPNLGSGELMIVTYFLLKIVSELSREEIIILIDDPELHLHPQLQYELFNKMQLSEYQHIFSTHSDIFVNIGHWNSIRRFLEGAIYPKKKTIEKEFRKSLSLDEKQPLRQHLNEVEGFCQDKTIFYRENNELLFSSKCLLVEGPNDKYGLIDFMKKLQKSNLSDLTIIYCGGKGKIPYYQMICLAFGIDFFVVYDLDKGSDDEGKDEMIKEFANSTRFFSFETSFDDIIGSKTLSIILEKISQMDVSEIPQEIKDCVEKIDSWSKNQ